MREDGDSDSGYDPNKDGIEPKELEGSSDADHESRLRLEFPLVPSDGERNQKFQCEKCHFQSDGFRRFRQHELR